jgi:hydroxyquinol 1,2-dioxygenase
VEAPLRIRTVVPSACPVPTDGPVGAMLKATGRHPVRPAHVHVMIAAAGHEILVTHVFEEGAPNLDSDAVSGARRTWCAPSAATPPAPPRTGA